MKLNSEFRSIEDAQQGVFSHSKELRRATIADGKKPLVHYDSLYGSQQGW